MSPPTQSEAVEVEAAPLAALPSARTSRRTRARMRRWAGRALLLVPAAAIVSSDLIRRHGRHGSLEHLTHGDLGVYAASAVISMLLWGALLAIATRRTGTHRWVARVLLVFLAFLTMGVQSYTFERFQ